MPEMKSYSDMSVEMVRETPYPADLVALAMQLTMSSDPEADIPKFTAKKAKYLIDAEHHSLFEHAVYTFLIQNVSRSFLAQITRQRTASPTSGSQHYQEYSDYPVALHPEVLSDPIKREVFQVNMDNSFGDYHHAIHQLGVPKEEARQMLPNGATVNYLWTIDARNLMYFLKTRLCYRNVAEMELFANKVYSIVIKHFPELFVNVGPQCYMDQCKQGFMKCDCGPWTSGYTNALH